MVQALASSSYIRFAFGRDALKVEQRGIPTDERLALAVPSTRFITRPQERQKLYELELAGTPLYTEGEVEHLVDVQVRVWQLTQLAMAGLLFILAIGFRVLRTKTSSGRRIAFARGLKRGAQLSLSIIVLIGLSIVLAWEWTFVTFHKLLFKPGTWQFSADSALIQLFPDRFWYDTAVLLVGGLVLSAAVLWMLAAGLEKYWEA